MADAVQHLTSATTIFLDQPPSCLEFCPDFPDHFVVGTYLLSETKKEDGEVQQSKTGSVQLWKLDPGTNELYVRILQQILFIDVLTKSQISTPKISAPIRSLRPSLPPTRQKQIRHCQQHRVRRSVQCPSQLWTAIYRATMDKASPRGRDNSSPFSRLGSAELAPTVKNQRLRSHFLRQPDSCLWH